jgi:hypothetical protein
VTKPHIHLAQFLCHGPTYHSLAMWRHPRTAAAGYDWARPEVYYFDEVGGDGFMLSPIYTPGAIEEFVDLVVPELQRRGRYRGTTPAPRSAIT